MLVVIQDAAALARFSLRSGILPSFMPGPHVGSATATMQAGRTRSNAPAGRQQRRPGFRDAVIPQPTCARRAAEPDSWLVSRRGPTVSVLRPPVAAANEASGRHSSEVFRRAGSAHRARDRPRSVRSRARELSGPFPLSECLAKKTRTGKREPASLCLRDLSTCGPAGLATKAGASRSWSGPHRTARPGHGAWSPNQ